MLEKVTMQRAQQSSAFSLLPKQPSKCSPRVVSQKVAIENTALLEKHLFLGDHATEFHEIWHRDTLGNRFLQ